VSHAGRPSARGTIVAIALNTFREAVRDRILYLMLAFALVMIVASRFLSMLTIGSEVKIVKDVGLSAISVFGVMTAIFVGVSLVFKEIDKRTIYTLLAQPVRRWQFVVGKFTGLVLVLTMNVLAMAAVLLALVAAHGESPAPLVPAIVLILIELLVVTAFAILFSTYTNPILAALGTVVVYLVGHLIWSFELLRSRLPDGPGRIACDVLYWVLPNLDRLDVKALAVHGVPVEASYLAGGALYGLGYATAVLVIACAVFERREFP
jgi:ABC-type transport system involved in multi-copper enzyme maturation permease subunit